jgi:hypothetical protein
MILRKIRVILINFFFIIYIFESFISIYEYKKILNLKKYYFKIINEYNNTNSISWDLTYRNDFIRSKVNDEKIKIYPRISPYSYIYKRREELKNSLVAENNISPFFLSGKSNSLTLMCNENSFWASFVSDRYGFNNNDKIWDSKIIEYFILGDSFAHGECVNRPHDISSTLNDLSNNSSLSVGYSGNGPLIELASMIEYAPSNVKKFVWMFYEKNDLADLENELTDYILAKYLDDNSFTQNLKNRQPEIDLLLEKKLEVILAGTTKDDNFLSQLPEFYFNSKDFIKFYKTRQFIKQVNNEIKKKNNKKIIKDFEKVITTAKLFANKNNSEFCFVYIPAIDRYKNFFYSFFSQKNLVINILKKNNIKIIDIDAFLIKKEIDKFYSPSGAHFNEYGYNLASNLIYKDC